MATDSNSTIQAGMTQEQLEQALDQDQGRRIRDLEAELSGVRLLDEDARSDPRVAATIRPKIEEYTRLRIRETLKNVSDELGLSLDGAEVMNGATLETESNRVVTQLIQRIGEIASSTELTRDSIDLAHGLSLIAERIDGITRR